MKNLLNIFRISTKEVAISLIIVGLALLFSNYYYTFSGFVAYTEGERRGCQLMDYLKKESPKTEKERTQIIDKLTEENQEIFLRYVNQLINKGRRCKTIQQFYSEESFVALFSILLPFHYLVRRKN